MTFAFASLVTHQLFRTDPKDMTINNTSSYLDLSILYGNSQEDQDAVRDKAPGKGQSKAIQTQQANNDALWLQNLTTSPATFLRRKFSLQDQEAKP